MNEALDDATSGVSYAFSGPFAKLDYVLKTTGVTSYGLRHALNRLRDFNRYPSHWSDEQLELYYEATKEAVDNLHRAIEGKPLHLVACANTMPTEQGARTVCEEGALRVMVRFVGEDFLTCVVDDEQERELKIALAYGSEDERHDFRYLLPYIQEQLRKEEPCRLNLVSGGKQLTLAFDDKVQPDLIIYEPDYLVNITDVASCFKPYGVSVENWLLRKFELHSTSQATVLGNLSGQMLDEEIAHHKDVPVAYKDSVLHYFKSKAIEIATTEIDSVSFHQEAKSQQQHLRALVNSTMEEMKDFDYDKVLLEPTFICEQLGVQGRMDLLLEDMHVLMEQKSGKMDEFRGSHKEEHYVQMLLYLAILHYGYGMKNSEVSPYLLYSKYDVKKGLVREGPAPKLLRKAIEMRNAIAYTALSLGEGRGREMLEPLTASKLRTNPSCSDRLWLPYVLPRIEETLNPIHNADELTKAYFYRFLEFEEREQVLAKLGNKTKQGSGFASSWNNSLEEKRNAGNILAELEIESAKKETEGEGVSLVALRVSGEEDEMVVPNFREGDYVMLYSYEAGGVPDIRQSMVFRANIVRITSTEVVVRLTFPQKNPHLFQGTSRRWAIESSGGSGTDGDGAHCLYSLLTAEKHRRDLLLCQTMPSSDLDKNPALPMKDYGDEEVTRIIGKAVYAKDIFLLVGPPGTGKTSIGLLNMVKEFSRAGKSVLLMAYTNRAVDEICSKLVKAKLDFVRLGREMNCEKAYREYLLENKVDGCVNVADIKSLIGDIRILVSTTVTMTRNLSLFKLRGFDVAIVDEASQILEPQLLGVMCAKRMDGKSAVEKFVLIGDYKQLPAVVQQTEAESRVQDSRLRKIGLIDCRRSLFERLYAQYKDKSPNCVATLTRQARMHEEIGAFVSAHYYGNRLFTRFEQQKEKLKIEDVPSGWLGKVMTHRMVFVDVKPSEEERKRMELADKVNRAESEVVREIVKALGREDIGVIVPYRHQIAEIRRRLDERGQNMTIDTVERYQGSERDVIIYSATVSRVRQLRFLGSNTFEENEHLIDRKLNVALTRARKRMIVVGNAELLSKLPTYSALIDYIKSEGGFVQVG